MSVNWLSNRKLLVSVIFLLTFFSCKKDRLKGGRELLIGEWEWVYSARRTDCGCNAGTSTYDTLTPISESSNYHMEVKKKGIIKFYKNGEKIDKKRIVFYRGEKGSLDDTGIEFSTLLNNNYKESWEGAINDKLHSFSIDTMVTWRFFPFKMGGNCNGANCFYYHYFIRK